MKNRDYERPESHRLSRYTLTTTGQVICLPEYCIRFANNSSVHVVLLHDMNKEKEIREEKFIHPSVRGKDEWNELNLQQRQGLSRLSFFRWCCANDTFKFFDHQRHSLHKSTFIFPSFMSAHTHTSTLGFVNKHEEMLIDLRDAKEMADLKLNVSK